jgi:hypothetical protein
MGRSGKETRIAYRTNSACLAVLPTTTAGYLTTKEASWILLTAGTNGTRVW